MTGFGRALVELEDKKILIELRALNSKFTDLRVKLPQNYKEKEADIRRIITNGLQRGKADMLIDVQSSNGDEGYGFNRPLFIKYYNEMNALSDELDLDKRGILEAIMRVPNIITSADGTLSDEEWNALQDALKQCLKTFTDFRQQEGLVLRNDMSERISIIEQLLDQVEPFEKERIGKLRNRLNQNLEEYLSKENVDENRFEQEVIFYLEKIDITEEKIRLAQHCKYFLEVLDNKKSVKGRKLNFIAQEIGREINTLGAKAYSSDIQRLVVSMKDELEKIKEQIANIV